MYKKNSLNVKAWNFYKRIKKIKKKIINYQIQNEFKIEILSQYESKTTQNCYAKQFQSTQMIVILVMVAIVTYSLLFYRIKNKVKIEKKWYNDLKMEKVSNSYFITFYLKQ